MLRQNLQVRALLCGVVYMCPPVCAAAVYVVLKVVSHLGLSTELYSNNQVVFFVYHFCHDNRAVSITTGRLSWRQVIATRITTCTTARTSTQRARRGGGTAAESEKKRSHGNGKQRISSCCVCTRCNKSSWGELPSCVAPDLFTCLCLGL